MFAPAEWEDDVPDNTVDFTKAKKTKNAKKNKQDRSEKKQVETEQVKINNNNNRVQHEKKRISKRTGPELELSTELKPQKKKPKRNSSPANELNDDVDEAIISKKKKELYQSLKPKELEEMLFKQEKRASNSKIKQKEKIKKILTHRTPLNLSGKSLRIRMLERLKAGQFRYLNEKLYLSESKEASQIFKKDPESFKVYHDGFKQQVQKWPLNPLDVIIKKISTMPKDTKVADMGCGEGMLAKSVAQKVRSFDLVSMADGVEECDMARTPLGNGEMDVAVYCLSLMGTNLKDYLIEANRILKVGGMLKIAEVESRFKDINQFVKALQSYGFDLTNMDDSKKVFYFMDFKKVRNLGKNAKKLPNIVLDPCLYKKR